MNKIKVTPEGRPGVWLITQEEAIRIVTEYNPPFCIEPVTIHCFLTGLFRARIGSDLPKVKAISLLNESDRFAILTGDALISNLGHALSAIYGPTLYMFDIGIVTPDMLEVTIM